VYIYIYIIYGNKHILHVHPYLHRLFRHPSNMLVVLGTNSLERIKSSAKAVTVNMSIQQWFLILEAVNGKECP
jgi:predicted oxidoreductase